MKWLRNFIVIMKHRTKTFNDSFVYFIVAICRNILKNFTSQFL